MTDEYWRASIVNEDGPVGDLSNLLLEFSPPSNCWCPIEARFIKLEHAQYVQIAGALEKDGVRIIAKQHDTGGGLTRSAIIERPRFVSGGNTQYGREHRTSYAAISGACASITEEKATSGETETWIHLPNSKWLAIHGGTMDGRSDGSIPPATVYDDLRVRFQLRQPEVIAEFRSVFDWHFSDHSVVRDECLVCHLPGVDVSGTGIREAVYEQVDDFLLMHYLATNEELVCSGAGCQTQIGHTTYYRRDKVIPRQTEDDYHEYRIDPARRIEFLSSAYESFQDSEYRDAIRVCCHALREHRSVIESRFFLFFSALEMLIGKFRTLNGREFIINEEWSMVRSGLKEQIRDVVSRSTDRAQMYGNLTGLNRVPLAVAFTEFSSCHDIDCSDLWPISSDDGEPTLISVRNRLVHGSESISNPSFVSALIVATHHLEWILVICVLALLGWSRTDTKLETGALRARYLIASEDRLDQARQLLKDY